MVEINYLIVPKITVPIRNRLPRGYWIGILDKLNTDNALRLEFDDVKVAQAVRNNIHGCFRQTRLNRLNPNYKIRSTLIRNSNGTRTLYVWKEKLAEEVKNER